MVGFTHLPKRPLEHLGQRLLEAINVVLDHALLVVKVLCLHQAHQRQIAASIRGTRRGKGGKGGEAYVHSINSRGQPCKRRPLSGGLLTPKRVIYLYLFIYYLIILVFVEGTKANTSGDWQAPQTAGTTTNRLVLHDKKTGSSYDDEQIRQNDKKQTRLTTINRLVSMTKNRLALRRPTDPS